MKDVNIFFRIEKSKRKALKERCKKDGVKVSVAITRLIDLYIKK